MAGVRWNSCCVLESRHTDPTQKQTSSCSGILIRPEQAFILTHSTLLVPYVNKDCLNTLLRKGYLKSSAFQNIRITAYMQKHVQSNIGLDYHDHRTMHPDKENLDNHSSIDKDIMQVSTPQLAVTNAEIDNGVSSGVESYQGSVVYLWRSAGFSGVLEKLMPKRDGWKLLDDEGKI